jgi:hypothetical protein
VLKVYAEVFERLNEVLCWKAEDIEKAAVEIMRKRVQG